MCTVHWNERFHKLATCDVMGVIFVWIKHEGRWSIELINDRNTKVCAMWGVGCGVWDAG